MVKIVVCVCVYFLLVSEGASAQSRYMDHSVLQHSITGLHPNTLYTISIHALYGNMEGPEISLTQLTGTDMYLIISTYKHQMSRCVAHYRMYLNYT